MQLNEWIRHHQKKLSLGIGGLLLVVAVGMMFWDNTGSSEDEAYAQKVAAMEARMGPGVVEVAPAVGESAIMKGYREKQEQNLRFTLILLIAGGIGFLVYGFVKKEEK